MVVQVMRSSRRDRVFRMATLVIGGGVVCGTWSAMGVDLTVTWFEDAGRVPRKAVTEEAARIGQILGREHELRVEVG
jgi:hypothetical protein